MTKKVLHVQFHEDVHSIYRSSVDTVILTLMPEFKSYIPVVASVSYNNRVERDDLQVTFYTFTEDKLINRVFNKILNIGVFTFSRLPSIINNERPNIVHFHNRHNLVDRTIGRLKYLPKVVCHYHRHFKELNIPNSCNIILTVSENMKNYILTKTNSQIPIRVSYNPIPFDLLSMQVREKMEVSYNEPTIIYVGGSAHHKGFQDLMSTVELLDIENIPYKLLLAGTGLNKENFTSPKIEVLGLLPHNKVLEHIMGADIFVHPAHIEPFGIAVLEAMYLKKLIVATHVDGLKEFLNNDNSIKVNPKDPKNLYKGMIKAFTLLSKHRDSANELQQKAFEDSKMFHPSLISRNLENLYDELL
ncbi:MAG: glycosyltransferase family 4 protein [Candidatus Magnetoovum sp. WYHC-5]|nr:glycosyltransferase family 4 protein [Candidatus Magnetoovum sp. WYHC-5]